MQFNATQDISFGGDLTSLQEILSEYLKPCQQGDKELREYVVVKEFFNKDVDVWY